MGVAVAIVLPPCWQCIVLKLMLCVHRRGAIVLVFALRRVVVVVGIGDGVDGVDGVDG